MTDRLTCWRLMSSLRKWSEKSETDLASSDGSASVASGPAAIEPTKSHTFGNGCFRVGRRDTASDIWP